MLHVGVAPDVLCDVPPVVALEDPPGVAPGVPSGDRQLHAGVNHFLVDQLPLYECTPANSLDLLLMSLPVFVTTALS